EHHLYRRRRIYRSGNIVTATKHVVVERLALHPLDQVIGRDAAAVDTLIDDDALLVCIAGETANRVHESFTAVAFDVDVTEPAAGKLFDTLAICFGPISPAQTIFTQSRKDRVGARVRPVSSCRNRDLCRTTDHVFK